MNINTLNINSGLKPNTNTGRKFYIETYGCQMNVADSELVASIMQKEGFHVSDSMEEADVIFVNTCSIRENAETRVFGRLDVYKQIKKKRPQTIIGVLGCMAKRLKNKLLEEEKMVDMVVGPDAYRNLPELLKSATNGQQAINVLLSAEETYADINPVRYNSNKISAFVSIMRGCDNMCAYCVVPFTRGRERSRNPQSILSEIEKLWQENFKEVTLLGQNVNSYNWNNGEMTFAQLLENVAKINPNLRVRFATSHPKDLTDDILLSMTKYPNICRNIHLPVQSGNTRILSLMRRNYTREQYLDRVKKIREIIPDCGLSSDFIAGFCSETEDEHKETLSLMETVKFDFSFMFQYSERPNTFAQRQLPDDVSEQDKTKRLTEIINLQNRLSLESNQRDIGKIFEVLVEGNSKKSNEQLFGRTSQNKVVVFPNNGEQSGTYVNVKILECTSATLKGTRMF